MSTILEALKKSERDRSIGMTPTIKTLRVEPLTEKKSLPIASILLGVILFVNCIFGSIWFMQKFSDSPVSPELASQDSLSSQDKTVATTVSSAFEAERSIFTQQPTVRPNDKSSKLNQEKALRELPTFYKDQLPGLDFQSHMFASEPKYRSVVINGVSYREGDFLHDSCKITAITQTGLLVQWKGQPYTLTISFAH